MKIKCNGKEFDIEKGTEIRVALKDEIENCGLKHVIAARYNNEVASLKHTVRKDGTIDFINTQNKDGRIVYIRGLLYLMSKAFHEVYPEALLTVNYQLSNAMFCQVDNMEVTEEMIANVKSRMQEIIDKDIDIRKVVMTKEEAEAFYKEEKNLRGRLQVDVDKDKVSVYYCEDFYNYFYGTMPVSTGFAKYYDLVTYRDGFLVKYPSIEGGR